ncbi:MAG: dihydroorotase [Betaproteobacteria bacterium]|nr:dihydroorotase [Betaproteobacteria bacterium]NBY06224.1 dihydroorotase [Betaproteobacteria bacterium]
MKTLIQHGRVIDPASGLDAAADLAIADGHIVAIGQAPTGFTPDAVYDASAHWVLPGLVDLCARLGEPGHEHEHMLNTELAAAVAGGVTSLVCPPDTDPVLDEPGLVDMLRYRAERLHLSRVYPLGALTRGLTGEVLTEMNELTEAGCVGFGQAEQAVGNTQVLQRAMQYAATFDYSVWLRPQELHLGKGVAASGPLATRLGLSGVPVAAETIALNTILALMRITGARVHICRLSSAAGVELVRQAKAEGLPISCDVSIHSLHLIDVDIGYFDSRARLNPPLRQQADRAALSVGLRDGTIDALVSDHTPVEGDAKALPFAQAQPGATGLELLLSMALKWGQDPAVGMHRALQVVTSAPAVLLAQSGAGAAPGLGQLQVGAPADVCVVDPTTTWRVTPGALRSQCKHTPFAFDICGMALPASVRATWVTGHQVYCAP